LRLTLASTMTLYNCYLVGADERLEEVLVKELSDDEAASAWAERLLHKFPGVSVAELWSSDRLLQQIVREAAAPVWSDLAAAGKR
jgi:hypothetical protein